MNNEITKFTPKVVEQINDLRSEIEDFTNDAKKVVIMTAESVDEGSRYIKVFARMDKRLDKLRKQITAPLDDQKKAIMQHFISLKSIYSLTNSKLQKDILSWNARQRQIENEKRLAEQKRLEEIALQEAIEKETKLKEQGFDNPVVEPAIIPETIVPEIKLSNYNTSGVTETRVAKWKITNELIIPREFLMIDEAKITRHRKSAGINATSDIAGIEFTTEIVLRR